MNRFTQLTLMILLLGITSNVSPQEMLYKTYKEANIPFYDDIAVRSRNFKQRTGFDTLWLPASVIERPNNDSLLFVQHIYEYHENGLLKKISHFFDGDLFAYEYYNNTYRDPLMDIPDTIFSEGMLHWSGEYFSPRRYYYNNRQADSSYWEGYFQIHDGEKWNTEERWYVHLLDTATVSEFQDHVEIFDRNGNIKEHRKTLLSFDDQGNVIEAVTDGYDIYNENYKVKYAYLYDEDDKCHTRDAYYYTSSSTWQLMQRLTDIKWFEFHGFDNGDLLFHGQPQGLYHLYSPKNKNKMSSLKFWELYGGNMRLMQLDTVEWEIYPPYYHYFCYFAYNMCLYKHEFYEYNDRYNLTSDERHLYKVWTCDTITINYVKQNYINKYDDRGRRYEYIWINTSFDEDNDSIHYMKMTYTVDSFTYVLRPVATIELSEDKHTLLIIPNPSGETVRITAADEIATVSFYAADGRLAYSRDGAGKEMNVNIQRLAKGVYVVQARLKSGGVQTGKVAVK